LSLLQARAAVFGADLKTGRTSIDPCPINNNIQRRKKNRFDFFDFFEDML
jgi:hypothetical protein